jgi:hypothetical protein
MLSFPTRPVCDLVARCGSAHGGALRELQTRGGAAGMKHAEKGVTAKLQLITSQRGTSRGFSCAEANDEIVALNTKFRSQR